MNEYKRLTNKDWKENYDIFEDVCCDTCAEDCGKCERNFNALVRLADIEDKIENGTLIELPCKVGDTLYFPQYYCDSRGCTMYEQSYCCGCKEMITRERNNEKYIIATKNCKWSDIPIIGGKYFVTRAEAEARLKELQENKK